MPTDSSRRQFLLQSATGVSALWVSANWPSLLAAAEHAHEQAKSSSPKKFEFFTLAEAAQVAAVAARIIPSGDSPGAHEAGVVYFIDRALLTFAKDQQKTYREGLPALQAQTKKLFPDAKSFATATPEQQDEILRSISGNAGGGNYIFGTGADGPGFFEIVRAHTVCGFLVDPDTRGNPNGVGWRLIGREREHSFQPPFGYYDQDYPGFQIAPAPAKQGGDA